MNYKCTYFFVFAKRLSNCGTYSVSSVELFHNSVELTVIQILITGGLTKIRQDLTKPPEYLQNDCKQDACCISVPRQRLETDTIYYAWNIRGEHLGSFMQFISSNKQLNI